MLGKSHTPSIQPLAWLGGLFMILRLNRKILFSVLAIAALAGVVIGGYFYTSVLHRTPNDLVAGGRVHTAVAPNAGATTAYRNDDTAISERFRRPSKLIPIDNPYSFNEFEKESQTEPLIKSTFETPEDVILAYYGILSNAANMEGYTGGCGTIGDAKQPYPYAYELLTKEAQQKISLQQFIDSFRGIGYLSLLRLFPAYIPPETPSNTKYYFVELELITGKPTKEGEPYNYHSEVSYFAYYYGIVTVKEAAEKSWLIEKVDYLPEEFLCAPMHSWFYYSDAVVDIVFGENLKLIDKIDKTEQSGGQISLYASGNGKQYRFDFIRITNGHDILLHEYIYENGTWVEKEFLSDDWLHLKMSIQNPDLYGNTYGY